MQFTNDFSIGKKMILMVIGLLAPSLLLLYATVSLQQETVSVAALELQGVDYAQALEEVAGPIAHHRGSMALRYNGGHVGDAQLKAIEDQVDQAMDALVAVDRTVDEELHNSADVQRLQEGWRQIVQSSATLSAQESYERHSALLTTIEDLNSRIADRSTLILDPQEVTYFLMDAAILRIPHVEMNVFGLRGAVASLGANNAALAHATRSKLAVNVDRVRTDAKQMHQAIEKVARLLPRAAEPMRQAEGVYATAANAFADMVTDSIVLQDQPRSISATAFELGTKSYEAAGELHDVLVPLLREELTARMSHAVWMRNLTLVGYVALMLTVAGMARRTRQYITRSAAATVQAIERLAGGNIGHHIAVQSRDEFGQITEAINRLDEKLVHVVDTMRSTADTVGSAAKELAAGNENLSGRTQQQAASVEETASSMEEMTATVKQNADNAMQANRLVASAREQAERGSAVVQRTVTAMDEINASSRKIADIISVIDEIAFQTNLLALNAAVEAARAGEQGRGFAVVASEVRNLAQRSASAAKEIKDLINDSVEKARAGAGLVGESGKTLEEIMTSVRKVTDIVADIAAASGEQSAGIEQVNLAITQMDNGTQENAALVEESAAVSKTIHATATRLVAEIGFFKLQGQSAESRRPVLAEQAPPRAASVSERRAA